jgi:hypothetical protein
MEAPTLAFCVLGVLMPIINATDAIRSRFGWPTDVKADRRQQRAASRAIDTWSSALNAEWCTAFGPLENVT